MIVLEELSFLLNFMYLATIPLLKLFVLDLINFIRGNGLRANFHLLWIHPLNCITAVIHPTNYFCPD